MDAGSRRHTREAAANRVREFSRVRVLIFLSGVMFFAFFFTMVIVMVIVMAVAALGEGRIVAGSLQAAAELKLDALEIDLFEREQGERLLIDRRRERFLALRRVFALHAPKPEASRQRSTSVLLENASIDDLLVVEARANAAFIAFEFDLFVLICRVAQLHHEAFERRPEIS